MSTQNLIVNGGFESDEVTLSQHWQVYGELDGWKALNNNIELQENGIYTNQTAAAGDQWLELDYNGNAVEGVYQDVQTVNGQDYTLSLDVALRNGTQPATNTILVYWNGDLVAEIEPASNAWQTLEFTVHGTGGLDRLTLAHDSVDADSYGGLIDNVSLVGIDSGEAGAGFDVDCEADCGCDDDDSGQAAEDADANGRMDDEIVGTAGDDILRGEQDGDTLTGGAGDDSLYGGSGNDVLNGGEGEDLLCGGTGDDSLQGGSGADSLYGGRGEDALYGDIGNDILKGGSGEDFLWGEVGNDVLCGGSGSDMLSGGEGNDTLKGGSGKDYLLGGEGRDLLQGGSGKDRAYGGEGNDTYVFSAGDSKDFFDGGSGNDTVSLSASGNDWTLAVDGSVVDVELADQALSLNAESSGVITFADGSELTFTGVEEIEWS